MYPISTSQPEYQWSSMSSYLARLNQKVGWRLGTKPTWGKVIQLWASTSHGAECIFAYHNIHKHLCTYRTDNQQALGGCRKCIPNSSTRSIGILHGASGVPAIAFFSHVPRWVSQCSKPSNLAWLRWPLPCPSLNPCSQSREPLAKGHPWKPKSYWYKRCYRQR